MSKKRKTVDKTERSKPEVRRKLPVAKLRMIKIEDGYAYCEVKLVLEGDKERESPSKQD